MPIFNLRDATASDAELVFGWRNDAWIIKKGSLNKEVPWDEHLKWFSALIDSPHCHMYIIEIEGEPAGQVRFVGDSGSKIVEVSIYLLEPFIGEGMGVKALKQACLDIKTKLNTDMVVAWVLDTNLQSIKAFEKAGFLPVDKYDVNIKAIETKKNHRSYYFMT